MLFEVYVVPVVRVFDFSFFREVVLVDDIGSLVERIMRFSVYSIFERNGEDGKLAK